MELEHYETPAGRQPVREFVEGLGSGPRGKVMQRLDQLEARGLATGPPIVKRIRGKDGLWELRIRFGSDIYRIIFVVCAGGRAVLLHGFAKKSQKVLGRDIWLAVSRMRDYLERNGR